MNRWYIGAGIVLVALSVGIVYWRTQPGETPEVVPTPMPAEAVSAAPETPAVSTSPPVTQTMKPKQYSAPPAMNIDPSKTYVATLTTDKGVMNVTLFAHDTPVTVNNFVFLARDGFYNTTVFHRVIQGFMVQGGDPQGTGMGGPGYKFVDEKITRDYTRGTIAMANSGPNTNGSQFFIMQADYALPKNYVIFGAINSTDSTSLATLDAIAIAPVTDNGAGENSKPVTPTVLQSVTIKEE